jgi:regulatory protein
VARDIVIRALAASPRSRAELADRLARRHVPAEAAEVVLDRFTEVGLVDDRAYAETVVHAGQSGRGLGKRAIAVELARRGVPDALAREALAQIDPDDERRAAQRLVAKRMSSLAGQPRAVAERRLAGMLARKGYPSGLIRAVVQQALAGREKPPGPTRQV